MFTLLDDLSKTMGIECTKMGGLIEEINSNYAELEGYYID
jgi:hypothetical protein